MKENQKALANTMSKLYCDGKLFGIEYYNEEGKRIKYDSIGEVDLIQESHVNEYDDKGRICKVLYSDREDIYEYDTNDYDVDDNLCKITTTYNKSGEQYPHLTINREKNEFSGITTVAYYSEDNKEPSQQEFYDNQGKLLKCIHHTYRKGYDGRGHLTQIDHSETTYYAAHYDNEVEQLDNNICKTKYFDGRPTEYEQYDEFGRVIKEWSDGKGSSVFEYKYENIK